MASMKEDLSPHGASGASGQQSGSQRLSTEEYPMPSEALSGYGTTDGTSMDHSMNTSGRRNADARRTREASGKASRGDTGPSKAPFDTVPGLGASDIDKAGRPGGLPDPVFRRGTGTTQRP